MKTQLKNFITNVENLNTSFTNTISKFNTTKDVHHNLGDKVKKGEKK